MKVGKAPEQTFDGDNRTHTTITIHAIAVEKVGVDTFNIELSLPTMGEEQRQMLEAMFPHTMLDIEHANRVECLISALDKSR